MEFQQTALGDLNVSYASKIINVWCFNAEGNSSRSTVTGSYVSTCSLHPLMKSLRECSFLTEAVQILAVKLGSQAMTSRNLVPHPAISKENFSKQ
jgi:hypothetical protein